MSQGIQERNLPVAESIGEGDKVRIVTAAGNSKNIDASLIGGGGNLILTETIEEIQTRAATTQYLHTLSATYNEMVEVLQNGGMLIVLGQSPDPTIEQITPMILGQGDTAYNLPLHNLSTSPVIGDVGYYLSDPFDTESGKSFYSATPDGPMTYTADAN